MECYPQPIMRWTESFYRNVFGDNTSYGLRENGGHSCAHGLVSVFPTGHLITCLFSVLAYQSQLELHATFVHITAAHGHV